MTDAKTKPAAIPGSAELLALADECMDAFRNGNDIRKKNIALRKASVALRLAAKPAEEREATIEECAKASIAPLTDAQKDNAENGFGALLRFEAIWNLAQRTSAAAVRALSTTQAPKP